MWKNQDAMKSSHGCRSRGEKLVPRATTAKREGFCNPPDIYYIWIHHFFLYSLSKTCCAPKQIHSRSFILLSYHVVCIPDNNSALCGDINTLQSKQTSLLATILQAASIGSLILFKRWGMTILTVLKGGHPSQTSETIAALAILPLSASFL